MLSLIICADSRRERVLLTLAACSSHRMPQADELIVVDEAAPGVIDGVLHELAMDPAPKVCTGPRRGRAAARNAGAAFARGELLVFLDCDVITLPSHLLWHVQAQAQRPSLVHGRVRELIAAAFTPDLSTGGRGFPALSVMHLCREGFDARGYRVSVSALERAVESRFLDGDSRIPQWLAGAGANFSIPRSLWEAMGGQAEVFGIDWGCEDLELSLRLCSSGQPPQLCAEAVGFHLTHGSEGRWEQHHRSLERFHALHPGVDLRPLSLLLGPYGSFDAYRKSLRDQ